MKKQNKILLSVTAVIVIVVVVLKAAGFFSSSEESISSALGYEMSAFDGVSPPSVAIDIFNSLEVIDKYDDKCKDHYDRTAFPEKWNLRSDELRRESLTDSKDDESGSSVVSGEWNLVYKQGTTTDPGAIHIEHGLPLLNIFCRAYSANGGKYFEGDPPEWHEEIANDSVLVFVVDGRSNESRGGASWGESPSRKNPDGWFPNNADVHCPWLALQGDMLKKYGLVVTKQERDKAVKVLEGCIS
tara:strand:+ start:665 stop:1393 length:729 start_codon:yes stop_codon:yes gene_type:complete